MISFFLQITGCLTIAIGVGLLSLPAGIVVGGVACVLIGLALEKGK